MMKKSEYKSAIRSRRLIKQAFVELMLEKNINKITVTEIITRADINRGTFYAHYQDTRAVIEQMENEVIEKMLEFLGELEYDNFLKNPTPLLRKFFNWLETDLAFYKTLINLNGSEQFISKLKDIFINYLEINSDIPQSIKKLPNFRIRVHFIIGGVLNLIQIWCRDEFDISLDELLTEISKLIINNTK